MKISRILSGRSRLALVAGAAALSLAALAPVAIYVLPDRANAAADAALMANAGGGALADLENRSPGSRIGGIATKAKRAIARLLPGRPDEEAVEAPEQRALGKVFDPPASDFVFSPLAVPEDPVLSFASPAEGPVVSPPFGGGSSGFVPGGPGGAIIPGNGGGGGGGGGGNPTDPTTPGAVPEPATWALMLLGFGAVGSAMRRQSRKGRLPLKA